MVAVARRGAVLHDVGAKCGNGQPLAAMAACATAWDRSEAVGHTLVGVVFCVSRNSQLGLSRVGRIERFLGVT